MAGEAPAEGWADDVAELDELVSCVNSVCLSPSESGAGPRPRRAAPLAPRPAPQPKPARPAAGSMAPPAVAREVAEAAAAGWEAVRQLERHSAKLHRDGRTLEAIEQMEQALAEREGLVRGEGGDRVGDVRVTGAAERLAVAYNSHAMSPACGGNRSLAMLLLRKAVDVCEGRDALVASRLQTLNNLACIHRKDGKIRLALRLLRESLRESVESPGIEDDPAAAESVAITHLNLCAILSQLGQHRRALEHAQAAVLHCQEQLLTGSLRAGEADGDDGGGDDGDEGDRADEATAGRIVVLGIAYHNMGVEEEHLGHGEAALEWYRKALRLAREHVGEDEPMTEQFRASHRGAQRAAKRAAASARRAAAAGAAAALTSALGQGAGGGTPRRRAGKSSARSRR